MARPTRLRPDATKALLDALRDGASVVEACEVARIKPRTFYAWLSRAKNDKDALQSVFVQFRDEIIGAQKAGTRKRIDALLAMIESSSQARTSTFERPANER